jgi:hypothetical protein
MADMKVLQEYATFYKPPPSFLAVIAEGDQAEWVEDGCPIAYFTDWRWSQKMPTEKAGYLRNHHVVVKRGAERHAFFDFTDADSINGWLHPDLYIPVKRVYPLFTSGQPPLLTVLTVLSPPPTENFRKFRVYNGGPNPLHPNTQFAMANVTLREMVEDKKRNPNTYTVFNALSLPAPAIGAGHSKQQDPEPFLGFK